MFYFIASKFDFYQNFQAFFDYKSFHISRFRDTYLSLGGGVPASEVFRRFRGRDPSYNALLGYYSQK